MSPLLSPRPTSASSDNPFRRDSTLYRPLVNIFGLKILLFLVSLASLIASSAADDSTVVPPPALPQFATDSDAKYSPVLDYDTDSCYNVPAIGIDSNGNTLISQGLGHKNVGYTTWCRDQSDLDNTNAYSRQRCNNDWCAYMYDYYFEKDVQQSYDLADAGHTHDWEHIIVWVKSGDVQFVSCSKHGNWESKVAEIVLFDGTHPKMVYNKDGISSKSNSQRWL
jgi:hypothetical protein